MCSLDHIRFCSYNCQGWRSGSDYVANLLQSYDLCSIQEHWLLPDHLGVLNNFLSVGTSGMDSHELLLGHPYGGCGILYQQCIFGMPCRAGWIYFCSII